MGIRSTSLNADRAHRAAIDHTPRPHRPYRGFVSRGSEIGQDVGAGVLPSTAAGALPLARGHEHERIMQQELADHRDRLRRLTLTTSPWHTRCGVVG
jgi:hypothetical protein